MLVIIMKCIKPHLLEYKINIVILYFLYKPIIIDLQQVTIDIITTYIETKLSSRL